MTGSSHNHVYRLLFLCGLGDALSTSLGLSLGFVETRFFFVPFLATAILAGAVWFIQFLGGLKFVREGIQFGLVLVAFSGLANNLMVILGVHSLSLLG